MIKKKRNLSDLFYNNRFLLVFSVCVAVIIWVIVAVEFSPETRVTIKNVPIRVVATGLDEESELKPFGAENLTADITIVGKRYIVEDDKIINDLEVVANTGYVNSPGIHRLTVDVGSVSTRPQYEIVSCSVNEIEVMYDVEINKSVPVVPEITIENGELAADGYFASDFAPSGDPTVTVLGPKTEVDLINSVSAVGIVEGGFTVSGSTDATLSLVMTNKAEPKYSKIITMDEKIASGQIDVKYYIYKETNIKPELRLTRKGIPLPEGQDLYDYNLIIPDETIFGFKDGFEPEDGKVYYDFEVTDLAFDEDNFYKETKTYKGVGDFAVKGEENKKGSVDVIIEITDNEGKPKAVSLRENGAYVNIESSDPTDNYVYEIKSFYTETSEDVDVAYIRGSADGIDELDVSCLRLNFSNVADTTTGQVSSIPLVVDSLYPDYWVSDENGNKISATVVIKAPEE